MNSLLSWLVFACLVASPVLSATFTETVTGAKNLQLAADVSPISGMTISVGHMTFKLASGSAARVLAAGEPVGIFFKGSGSLEYETAETTELPAVKFNVHAESHLNNSSGGRAVLGEPFGELLFVKAGGALPELTGTGGASLAEAFTAHRALFARAKSSALAHGLALQKFGVPAAMFADAEVSGGGDNLAYRYDAVDTREESLILLRPYAYPQMDKRLADRLYPLAISSQPIGHDRKVTAKPLVGLTDVDYLLVADGDNARLEVTETLFRANPVQNAIRLDMEDELFVKVSRPMRTFNVRSVTDAAGRALPFDHTNTSLIVSLDGVPGQVFKLKFIIDGDFLVREGGDNAWQLGTWAWFPQPESFAAQAYTVHSLVKVKKPFVPFAPGKTIARREEGDFNVVETSIDRPVQFAVVHAGKYTTVEDTRDGITVRIASYGLPRPRASKQLIDLAFGLIDYYQYFLGPFPFPEFNIIQVNSYGWGQAPPATMFITNEAFDPIIDEEAQYFSEGINERFAHEIAHQYWAHVVKMPSLEEQWLTESFAEYSAALALKKLKGEAVYNRLVNGWRSRAKQASGVAPIPYANRIGGDPRMAFSHRFGLLYAKGPYLLYTLHKQIGDTQFLTFLKSYQKSFQWKFGTTNDVAGLLQFMTKTDYKPFLDQYFWGTAMPN
ncbi:MAG TPA: M1 family aminopeptidase [Thermoanaerobaculia bacterium]